jgi:hypothetical protein
LKVTLNIILFVKISKMKLINFSKIKNQHNNKIISLLKTLSKMNLMNPPIINLIPKLIKKILE